MHKNKWSVALWFSLFLSCVSLPNAFYVWCEERLLFLICKDLLDALKLQHFHLLGVCQQVASSSQCCQCEYKRTCGPGILGRISAEWWQTCGSFGIELSAANLEQSSGSWCRPHGTYQPGASPGTPPDLLGRRSWSYRTGTCPAPEIHKTNKLRDLSYCSFRDERWLGNIKLG